jgi:hypothetical protein
VCEQPSAIQVVEIHQELVGMLCDDAMGLQSIIREMADVERNNHFGRGLKCVFTLYIDDSGTSPAHKIAVAAVWIAPYRQWLKFDSEWKRVQEKEGFECFHTAECVASNPKSEFKDWDKEKKRRVIERLRQITKKYVSRGVCYALYKKDFDEVVTGEFRETVGRYHYTIAIRSMLENVKKWRSTRPLSDKFEFVFDWMEPRDVRRSEIEQLMRLASKATDAREAWGIEEGSHSFHKRCSVLPLQTADLLAWSFFQVARYRYEGTPVNEFARETLQDFGKHDGGGGKWLDTRIWRKEKIKEWVTAIHHKDNIHRLAQLRFAMDVDAIEQKIGRARRNIRK